MSQQKNSSRLLKAMQIISLVLMISMAVGCVVLVKVKGLGAEDIKSFAPENLWLAAIAVIVFYVVKSFSLVFPLPILYVGVGLIFPNVYEAFIVNFVGVALSLTLPFFLGKFMGKDMVNKLTERFPKIKKLDEVKTDNEFIFVFILKLSGVLACDLSSLLLGAMNVSYKKFMLGSICGLAPLIIAWTFLSSVLDPTSPLFYLAIAGIIAVAVGSSMIYKKYAAKKAAAKRAIESGVSQ